jgi:hypothetical protein
MNDETKLRLGFADLLTEIEAVPRLAQPFLSPEGSQRLDNAKHQLRTFTSRPETSFTWQIPREEPVTTKPSKGQYERKPNKTDQKSPDVVGALSFCWHMKTGPKPVRHVYLVDNASTELRIYDGESEEATELRTWQMDIGLKDSPGCCFHTQVGQIRGTPHPSILLPVPRLPSFPPTPMSCLEFLLSELFQRQWQEHVERDSPPMNMWRGIQRQRLSSFLRWQLKEIEQTTGSPLVHLKAFPGSEILMDSATR